MILTEKTDIKNFLLSQMFDNFLANEVRLAYHLYETYSKSLLKDKEMSRLLLKLDQDIESTQKAMVETGVKKECALCAVSIDETCCGKNTGYKYDKVLILINLLLGRFIPIKLQDPLLCYFLMTNGCILKARHVICVNFICHRLYKNIQHEKLVYLQEIAGCEMETLFIVEEYIKKRINH